MRAKGLAVAEANHDSVCSRPASVINERLRDSTPPEGRGPHGNADRSGDSVGATKNAGRRLLRVRQAHIERSTHRHGKDVDDSQKHVSWVEHPGKSTDCADGKFILW